MRLTEILRNAERKLTEHTIDSPALDARILIGHALGLDRTQMMAQADRFLTPDETARIDALIARRIAHEPVGRILGEREFWSLSFGLNEATLEPRPDSETVVEVALQYLREIEIARAFPLPSREGSGVGAISDNKTSLLRNAPLPSPPRKGEGTAPHLGQQIRLLDLGTGTGCLLLSLLHELPNATGMGIDIAPRAVEQATLNAKNLNLSERSTFKTGNWFEDITEKFDAIISNPPYIPAAEIPTLMPEVREHDPLRALDGGADGLDIYRFLIPQLPQFLKANGFVIFEVGQGQADDVAMLCRDAGLANITKHKDLHRIERCVAAWARPA